MDEAASGRPGGRAVGKQAAFSTIDAHVAGEPVRLLVGGAPAIAGRTMGEKLAWLRSHGQRLRRSLMLEPRGHAAMHGALLTEPVSPGSHAGILSMHAAGFPELSGESVIAAATIALENRLIEGAANQLIFDTPAGAVRAHPYLSSAGRVERVALTNVPSFVFSGGGTIRLGKRALSVDIAFAGEFYAIVDGENAGLPVDGTHAAQLIAAAADIRLALAETKAVNGVIFTAPPRGEADLRSATVLYGGTSRKGGEGGILRRSPGLTGTCALLAVLDAMGLVAGDQAFTHEGVIGTTLKARVLSRHTADGTPRVVPVVEATAWITGRHEFEVDESDPMKDGFVLGTSIG
jgi:proline racemase